MKLMTHRIAFNNFIRAGLAALALGTHAGAGVTAAEVDPLANPPTPAFEGQTGAPAPSVDVQVERIATDLQLPRSLVTLPDGRLLVTENRGTVRLLTPDGELSAPLPGMPEMFAPGGRSMNDFILDAGFADNRRVYFTYNAPNPDGDGGVPRVARATLSEDYSRINDVEVIADIPGRRLASHPDGTLFITVMGYGDLRPQIQKLTTLTGKVLRINGDGSIPDDNPYVDRAMVRDEIWAVGHRDQDGAMIHPETGELWTIEHGPMGGDELNVVRAGKNYGWPVITYGKNYDGTEIGPSSQFGMEQPLYYWFPSVAPSGLLMYTGDMFAEWQGSLLLGTMSPTQGKFLVRLVMGGPDGERVMAEEHLLVDHDRRVRALAQGADGAVFVLTDSEDNDELDRHFPGEVLRLTPARQ